MSALAKKARMVLGAGRNYIKPNAMLLGRLFDVRVPRVMEILQAGDDPDVLKLASSLERPQRLKLLDAEEQLLDALAPEKARTALAQAAAKVRFASPTEARAVAQMLGECAARAPRGAELADLASK